MQTNSLQRLKLSLGRFGKMIKWIKSFFYAEYEVTIWYTSTSDSKLVFKLTKLLKKSNTAIEGLDLNKKPFEFSSSEPFNYQIRKIH